MEVMERLERIEKETCERIRRNNFKDDFNCQEFVENLLKNRSGRIHDSDEDPGEILSETSNVSTDSWKNITTPLN